MENMNMNELRSLARERNLTGYSRLRKANLINLLRLNVRVSPNAIMHSMVPKITERNLTGYIWLESVT